MCGFLEAKSPSPPCLCRISGHHYFLQELKEICVSLMYFLSSMKSTEHMLSLFLYYKLSRIWKWQFVDSVCACVCTYELSEASDRKSTGSCDKLKQTDSLLVVHLLHHLQEHNFVISGHKRYSVCGSCVRGAVCPYLPEPVDLLAVLCVVSIDGVFLPVGQIDLLHPAKHQLQRTA